MFIQAFATAIARANDLVAFGDIPFSAHIVAAKEAPEPTGYAKRIQLVSKGKLVDTGKCLPGSLAIVDGESVVSLGKEIDFVPLAVLDKALDCSGGTVSVEFGRSNPKYQEIANRSLTANSGCMFGPCFLVWERTHGQFFEIFLNNKSARMEAAKLYPHLPISAAAAKANGIEAQAPKRTKMATKYVTKGKNSWFVPVVTESTAKFDKVPTNEQLITAVTSFLKQGELVKDEQAR